MNYVGSNCWSETPPEWFAELPDEQAQEIEIVASVYDDVRISRSLSGTPLVRLAIAGENVSVMLLLEIPAGYPHEKCVKVSFRSTSASSEVLQDIESKVQAAAEEQFATGTSALMTLLGRASELVSHLPLALQSTEFCCCVHCNSRLLKIGQQKAIQPARVLPDDSGVECLACRSQDAILIPSAVINITACCTYCMCEDNPLIKLECGCMSCTTCWKTFADIATGSNHLQRHSRTRQWGVACPNHPTVPVCDGGLLKLCESRCYLRFNQFALEKVVEQLGGYWCPQPGCNAIAICSDVAGGLMKCKGCRLYSCTVCFALPTACTCELLSPSVPQRRQNQLAVLSHAPAPPKPACSPPAQVMVMLWWARERKVVSVATASRTWVDALLREMESEISQVLRDRDQCPLFVFSGVLLSPGRELREYGIYNGSVIYAVEYFPQLDSKERREELELWEFRRAIAASAAGERGGDAVTGGNPTDALVAPGKKPQFKRCPFCQKPCFHYRNHGCHHIGAFGRCCERDWCFSCCGPWPCERGCKLFCWDGCDCPPCPECVPQYPCVHCSGCDQCQIAFGEVMVFE